MKTIVNTPKKIATFLNLDKINKCTRMCYYETSVQLDADPKGEVSFKKNFFYNSKFMRNLKVLDYI